MAMKITICMGSSCYARGNGRNLELIERFLETDSSPCEVSLVGCRCTGACGSAPNIEINGVRHEGVDPGTLEDLLAAHTQSQRKADP